MPNKKKKVAQKKQKKRKDKLKARKKGLVIQTSKPRWVGWMRKVTYEEQLMGVFTKEALGGIQATLVVDIIKLCNAGEEPFVRMELSAPNDHVNALRNFVQRNLFQLIHYGRGQFIDLEARQRCPINCKFSRKNLFLVGFLSEGEYKIFKEINTEELAAKSTMKIVGYTFSRENRMFVEVYADINYSMQRKLVLRELANLNFQEIVFSPS
jgi:hypothetical protein